MMQTGPAPLPEVATAAGISTDKARHWVEALGYPLVKIGRCRHVPPEAVPQVREMARLVAGGMSPQAAAATLKAVPVVEPQPSTAIVATPQAPDVSPRLESLERAVLLLVEEIRGLKRENQILRLRFEPSAADPLRRVEPWHPEPRPDPAEGMPWWKVAWLSLVAPEQLRRCDT